jgi:hypothetical protein
MFESFHSNSGGGKKIISPRRKRRQERFRVNDSNNNSSSNNLKVVIILLVLFFLFRNASLLPGLVVVDEDYISNGVPQVKVVTVTTTGSTNTANEKKKKKKKKYGQQQQQQLEIDIISIGSHKESDLLSAQHETFGSHATIRQFRIFNEADDHEQTCATDLEAKGNSSWSFISKFCRALDYSDELMKFRSRFARAEWIEKKGSDAASAGWLCAQKRPAESLYKVLKGYRYNNNTNTNTTTTRLSIPDYLFLLDADTYLNMDNILARGGGQQFLPSKYPPDDTLAIAGCRIKERVNEHNFTFPWGGFGTIFTRGSIERFLHPIHNCNINENHNTDDDDLMLDPKTKASLKTMSYREHTNNEFERLICSKISEDLAGEAFLFHSGMSVADLMYNYVTHWNYVNAQNEWIRNPKGIRSNAGPGGFCFHADWVIGYFVNHYYLSTHDNNPDSKKVNLYYKDNPEHRLRGYNGSEFYAGLQNAANIRAMQQCNNDYDHNCNPATAHFCHHVSASKMRELSATNGMS